VKVLQVMAGAEKGGAEKFFTRLVPALHRAGIDQRVMIRRDATRASALREAGLVPIECRFGGALDIFTPRRIAREIADYRPDIVLSWMNRAASMCPKGNGHVHCGRLGGYYNLKYYRTCDHLIGNTQDIVDYLVSEGWPADRAHYLPNFVDARIVPAVPRATHHTPNNARVVLALGRLHENKAFDVLLRAIAKLPDVYLWLGGSGPLEAQLRELAQRLGINPRVRFLGWIDDPAPYFAAADVLACPSRIEPLGNVVIEAWANRRPVVASEASGPKQLIEPGQNGLLFPLEDHEALADRLYDVLTDKGLAQRLSDAGHASYQAQFTEAAVVARYIGFFEKVAR
jgi:glycosyltransferase involved in cell wall biosynthesis